VREKLKLFSRSRESGTISYDKENDEYAADLNAGLSGEDVPAEFQFFYPGCIPEEQARLFVMERVLPRDRMGISWILEQHGLKEWSAWEMLKIADGRSVRDFYSAGVPWYIRD
jgi:hypothetical protein